MHLSHLLLPHIYFSTFLPISILSIHFCFVSFLFYFPQFFLSHSHSFSHTPTLPRLPFALSPLSSSDGGHKSLCCQRARLVGLCNAAIHLEPEERTRLRPPSTHHVSPTLASPKQRASILKRALRGVISLCSLSLSVVWPTLFLDSASVCAFKCQHGNSSSQLVCFSSSVRLCYTFSSRSDPSPH